VAAPRLAADLSPPGTAVTEVGAPVEALRWSLLAYTGVLVVLVAVLGLHVAAYQRLSPIDELQHLDYTYRVLDGDVPRRGDLVGQEAMRDQACRGIDDPQVKQVPCLPEGSYDPATFQEAGQNTAFGYLPPYYAVTAAVATAVTALTPVEDFANAARLAGILWAALAAAVVVAAFRRLGVRALTTFFATTLLVTHGLALHSNATVNPDATTLLGGALLLALPILLGPRPGRWAGPTDAAAAVLALALKVTNVIALVAGVVFRVLVRFDRLGSGAADDASGAGRRLLRALPSALPVAAGGLVAMGLTSWWAGLDPRLPADEILMNRRFAIDGFPWSGAADEVFRLGPLTGVYFAPPLRAPVTFVLSAVVGVLVLVAVAWVLRERSVVGRLAVSCAVAVLAGGPLVAVVNYVGSEAWIGAAPARYYQSLLPGLALVAGSVADRSRAGRWSAGLLCVAWVTTIVVRLASA
jgi:hypothetical protein